MFLQHNVEEHGASLCIQNFRGAGLAVKHRQMSLNLYIRESSSLCHHGASRTSINMYHDQKPAMPYCDSYIVSDLQEGISSQDTKAVFPSSNSTCPGGRLIVLESSFDVGKHVMTLREEGCANDVSETWVLVVVSDYLLRQGSLSDDPRFA